MLQEFLTKVLGSAIVRAFPDFVWAEDVEVVPTANEQFGHYQCNSCLKMAKDLKKNPRDLASQIVSSLYMEEGASDFLEKVEVAGPGFINIVLSNQFLSQQVSNVLLDPFLGVKRPKSPKKVIVEFSSPNVAKELHVGHLRSTIIGDCIARIFEYMGEEVLRLNHIGDFGTQFGMLIAFLEEEHPEVLSGEERADLTSLMQWYKDSKKRFDADADFKKKAQLQVVRLQAGEEKAVHAWKIICQISRDAFSTIYQLLDVKIVERGESFYSPFLHWIVSDLEKKGLITVSHGAKCIFLDGMIGRDGEPLPMIIQKSDGGFNYDTTDMAALWHRVHEEKADRIIILTDAGQALHFQMLFQVAQKAGYYDPSRVRMDHVVFGVVLGSDGTKFKTRSGETEKLIDLLQEAVNKARNIIEERLPDASDAEKDHAAHVLGVGAVKYADLSGNRIKDYVFSYDRMLRFDGNTAAFLLYAFVRIQGIKRKKGFVYSPSAEQKVFLEHPSEVSLGLHICRFAEILVAVTHDLLPNRLADYLYTLANKFNAFYRDCRVEGAAEEESRLTLCEATARVLQKGLELLGLQTLNRM